jgi:hypothetical protein
MALRTLGTAANNTLSAFVVNTNDTIPADVATFNVAIKDDQINGNPIFNGPAYQLSGMLWVPNRGWLKALPGDFIAFDPATGWPILLSARAAAGASWVHVP